MLQHPAHKNFYIRGQTIFHKMGPLMIRLLPPVTVAIGDDRKKLSPALFLKDVHAARTNTNKKA